jgi:hypothetical protein
VDKNLLNFISGKGKIALVVASGIATLLLPGGRTPHPHFKIPLEIRENSMSNIKNTHLSELIQQTSRIIWDVVPVNHRHCSEALYHIVRDILFDIKPTAQHTQFGGIIVVLGGDFHQTLLDIQNGYLELAVVLVHNLIFRFKISLII